MIHPSQIMLSTNVLVRACHSCTPQMTGPGCGLEAEANAQVISCQEAGWVWPWATASQLHLSPDLLDIFQNHEDISWDSHLWEGLRTRPT